MKVLKSWFSLIEIMVGIIIISFVMIAWFQALASVWISKVKLIERTQIEKEAFFASEKFFEMIKKWGTLDYEEYWNRYNFNTTYMSGHFSVPSDFGNIWTVYHCLSWSGVTMPLNGCVNNFNIQYWGTGVNSNYANSKQSFNRYKYQFIDFNGDADGDAWNENGLSVGVEDYIGDDDDLFLWIGPTAFPNGIDVGELYLIDNTGTQRTFFRWNVIRDPDAPTSATCTGTKVMTGTWCLWTIEFLKLTGVDEWYDHSVYAWAPDGWYWDGDGEIDTWLLHQDFDPQYATGLNPYWLDSRLALWSTNMWQPIFPNSIHVSNVEFYAYPNKNLEYSWRDNNPLIQTAPYVRLNITLQPSWKEKRKIRGQIPSVTIRTTIQLSDLNYQ